MDALLKSKMMFGLCLFVLAAFSISCSEEVSLCPDENHPHAIDLGLPNGTKWSCCNLGAPTPESSGGYYSWGETNVKSEYNGDNYYGPRHLADIAGTEYDAATVNWGDEWRMPNYEQVSELLDYCKVKKGFTYHGVKGYLFTGPSGKSFFLPFCGYRVKDSVSADFQGYVWTSTRYREDNERSVIHQSEVLKFNKKYSFHEILPMEWGLNIRPITR